MYYESANDEIKWRPLRLMVTTLLFFALGAMGAGCDSSSTTPSIMSSADMSSLDQGSESDQSLDDQGIEEPIEEDPLPAGPQGRLATGIIGRGHWDGVGDQARFDGMVCATIADDQGSLYIADAFSGTVRSVDLETKEVSTLSGFPYEFAVFDGPIDQARFESPRGCGIAPEGLLIADSATLRWIDFNESTVSTLTGRAGDVGDQDGDSSEARLGYLTHDLIWSLSGEYALLSDRSNDRIRLFVKHTQTLYALGPLNDEDRVLSLNGPGGLDLTDEGDLLIADTFNGRVIRVNLSALNLDEQLAQQREDGDQINELPLDLDSLQASVVCSGLSDPQGITTDGQRAWVAGFEGELTEIDLMTGDTLSLALNLRQHKEPPLGGAFASLVFNHNQSVIYYLDINTESIRQIDPETGVVQTIVGPKETRGDRDGDLDTARFGVLYDVVATERGWIVADPESGKVKEIIFEEGQAGVNTIISAAQTVGSLPLPSDRQQGQAPVALAYDRAHKHLYIADLNEHVIRRYDVETQTLELIIGEVEVSGGQDGIGVEARLNQPFGLDFADDGLLYIADAGNRAIRSFDPVTQEVRTVAQGEREPFDVLKHQNGNIYVVDGVTPALFKVEGNGFELVIGHLQEAGPGDGLDARFASPLSLTRHPQGGILIADGENHRIRLVDLENSSVSTWVGQFTRHGGWGHRDPLPWEEIRLQSPNAVALSQTQAIVLSDTGVILLEDSTLSSGEVSDEDNEDNEQSGAE